MMKRPHHCAVCGKRFVTPSQYERRDHQYWCRNVAACEARERTRQPGEWARKG